MHGHDQLLQKGADCTKHGLHLLAEEVLGGVGNDLLGELGQFPQLDKRHNALLAPQVQARELWAHRQCAAGL